MRRWIPTLFLPCALGLATAARAESPQDFAAAFAAEPLAPFANPERFTRPEKVAKWFKRNCRDVLARECTAQEKGDVLAFVMTGGK